MDPQVRPGMVVLSVDGQTLGRIARIEGAGFEVVRGNRQPEGFSVTEDELCSWLQSVVFLRLPYHRYAGRFAPRKEAPPETVRREGRRFLMFRKVDQRW